MSEDDRKRTEREKKPSSDKSRPPNPADQTLKNFRPTDGSGTVDPMVLPPFPIGAPVGGKPKSDPSSDKPDTGGDAKNPPDET
jgi:hypothetical protein